MKKLFTAIRRCDAETVKALIEKSPDLLSAVSTGAPKKDEGQSPLQVALKASSEEIVNYLLDKGADMHFMEAGSVGTRMPALHDGIIRAVSCCRWNVLYPDGIKVFNSKEEADSAFRILEKMLALGADVNIKDSAGGSCLCRAFSEAANILPRRCDTARVMTDEVKEDVSRIFDLLIAYGADVEYTKASYIFSFYKDEPVASLLK